ncbi:hypothetical protein Afil01_42180 [Actinorhabdospora filicis]|uniref:HipA-like kinase domain-containing protein n=1 Tax=Actinorhabdospora filicis TaxID=1785913 RepID=A0A9W6SNV7_9ACTN|nr:HipA family kinase [Actinorhabdospora filicis]GLZ79411.1 hypothetical protein Afil01_42180 [Actinorhabdospora filicis]
MLPAITAIRYVTPLKEGGSLPGLVEADDLGTYVVKWRGAGQGPKALVAEVIVGELARALGLPVPDLADLSLDEGIAKGEPDPEVQELLLASVGDNLAMDFLPASLGFDPAVHKVEPGLASRIVWLDAFTENVDRTWRNPNLLVWHGEPWLIDHGASLYFHHNWPRAAAAVTRPFKGDDHVLAAFATDLPGANAELGARVTPELLDGVLALVPDAWLDSPDHDGPDAVRAAYREHLLARVAASGAWLPEVSA